MLGLRNPAHKLRFPTTESCCCRITLLSSASSRSLPGSTLTSTVRRRCLIVALVVLALVLMFGEQLLSTLHHLSLECNPQPLLLLLSNLVFATAPRPLAINGVDNCFKNVCEIYASVMVRINESRQFSRAVPATLLFGHYCEAIVYFYLFITP